VTFRRCFVTGGSGFVGRRLIAALRARGDEVRALARSDAAIAAVLAAGATPVRGDLDDVAAMQRGMDGCAWVFHAAAHTAEWAPAAAYERVTVQGTRHALAAARAAGVARFVHVGSEAALVDGTPLRRVDESRPLPRDPLPGYPASKAASEALVRAANDGVLQTLVVRPRLIWGAGDTTLLPPLVDAVRRGRFRWIGGGGHLTSTCHVDNAVEGLLCAAERGRGGEAYFDSDGAPLEFRDFITRLLATQGVAAPRGSLPYGVARCIAAGGEWLWRALPLPGKPPLTRLVLQLFGREVTVDDGKARRELGYRGATSIEAGLAAMTRAARP
jgi:nucleoside-diphosphate-sugar epimerase